MATPELLDPGKYLDAFKNSLEFIERRSARERTLIAVVLGCFAAALIVLPAVGLGLLVGYVGGATLVTILVVMLFGGRVGFNNEVVVKDSQGRPRIVLGVYPTEQGEFPGLFLLGEDGESSYFCVLAGKEASFMSLGKPGSGLKLTAISRDDNVKLAIQNLSGDLVKSISSPHAGVSVGQDVASAHLVTKDEEGRTSEVRWPPTPLGEFPSAAEALKRARERRGEAEPSAPDA